MPKFLLIAFSVLLFIPNLFKTNLYKEAVYNCQEEYKPALNQLNSMDKLENYFDSLVAINKPEFQSFEYVNILAKIIREKFYHGYSHFTLNENWVAALCGKYVSEGLSCKVKAEDIVGLSNAACSQQVIVMMAILRHKGIFYRHLGFAHHYTIEVLIRNKWYFFDPNLEPSMSKEQRVADNWQYHSDNLKKYYAKRNLQNIDFGFGRGLRAKQGEINEVPALHARIFQDVTFLLSKTLWCFPLLLIVFPVKNFSFRKRPFLAKPVGA